MKKNLMLIAVILVISCTPLGVIAESNENEVNVQVDGKLINFPDAKPFIDDSDRTLVPVRFIAENLGSYVSWDGEQQEVGINSKDKNIKLVIGQSEALVNDNKLKFDTKAMLKENRTFVPLRFVSEVLGAKVEWDKDTRTVNIFTKDQETLESSDQEEVITEYIYNEYGIPQVPDIEFSTMVSEKSEGIIAIRKYNNATLDYAKEKYFKKYFPNNYDKLSKGLNEVINDEIKPMGVWNFKQVIDNRMVKIKKFDAEISILIRKEGVKF